MKKEKRKRKRHTENGTVRVYPVAAFLHSHRARRCTAMGVKELPYGSRLHDKVAGT